MSYSGDGLSTAAEFYGRQMSVEQRSGRALKFHQV